MKTLLSRQQNSKTRADESSRLLQLQAADALRKGNYAEMFKLDRLAAMERIRSHNQFFEISLKAINTELNPMPKFAVKTSTDAPRVSERRVFKLVR
jgi:hypothetical protein